MRGVLEVDADDAAHRAGRLVHQAAGLAEKDVLGILADLRDADLAEFVHVIIVVFAAEDRRDADLEGRRAGQAGTAQHVAGGAGVKAAHLAAVIEDTHRHAADQGGGVFSLPRLRGTDAQVHIADLFKTLGLDAHDVVLIGGDHRHDVQVDRTGQHDAVVVVGVVAADLGAAGGRVQADRAFCAELGGKMIDQRRVTLTLGGQDRFVRAVQFGKGAVVQPLRDLLLQFHGIGHNSTRLSFWTPLFRNMHKKSSVNLDKQPKTGLFVVPVSPV